MMDEITARRWEMNQKPDSFKPIDCLKAMIRDIESGEIDPEHIIIVFNKKVDEEHGSVGYYQAGNEKYLGSIGMLTRATHIMAD